MVAGSAGNATNRPHIKVRSTAVVPRVFTKVHLSPSSQLPEEVTTNGVVAEVPRFPIANAHAKTWQDVARCGETWHDTARCGELHGEQGKLRTLKRNTTKPVGFTAWGRGGDGRMYARSYNSSSRTYIPNGHLIKINGRSVLNIF